MAVLRHFPFPRLGNRCIAPDRTSILPKQVPGHYDLRGRQQEGVIRRSKRVQNVEATCLGQQFATERSGCDRSRHVFDFL